MNWIKKLCILMALITSINNTHAQKATTTATALQADLAVDMVGLNTHFAYDGIYNDQFTNIIKPRLMELGVRHLRDGNYLNKPLCDSHMRDLAAAGIRFILIQDPRFQQIDLVRLKDHVIQLNAGKDKIVEMVEGMNEFDCSNPDGFMPALITSTKELWNTFKNDPATDALPIAGPSFCNTSASAIKFGQAFPDASNYMEYGNLHNYPGGVAAEGPIGGGAGISLDAAIQRYKGVSGNDTLITTETGYKLSEEVEGHPSISERAAAKYIPRLMLTYLEKGIKRAYLYQLINYQEDFGIINMDGSPRMQYTALKNYMHLLQDPGPVFQPASLTWSVTGDQDNIKHLLLQKRNGDFYLILWQGVNSANGHVDIDPPARKIKLTFPGKITLANIYTPTFEGINMKKTYKNPKSIDLLIPDHIVVVQIRQAP